MSLRRGREEIRWKFLLKDFKDVSLVDGLSAVDAFRYLV